MWPRRSAVCRSLPLELFFPEPAVGRFLPPTAKNMSVRCVPKAEVNPGILNGSYWESGCSDLKIRGRKNAQMRRLTHPFAGTLPEYMRSLGGLVILI